MSIPKDEQAEYDMLAVLLVKQTAIFAVSGSITPEMFYVPEYRNIYQAMINLHSKHVAVDMVTVSHELDALGVLNAVGGRTYISDMSRSATGTYNVDFYADKVIRSYRQRKIIQASQLMAHKAAKNDDPDQLISDTQQILIDVATMKGKNQPQSVGVFSAKLLTKMVDQAEAGDPLPGISTGYAGIDSMTHGFSKGDVIVLAARPQMGKTTLAMNIALSIAIGGDPVLMVSMEMSGEKLSRRLLAAYAGIRLEKLQLPQTMNQDEWAIVNKAIAEFEKLPIEIIESTDVSALDVVTAVHQTKLKYGGKCGLVALDYLQLMKRNKTKSSTNNDEISEISRSVKGCAMALDVPILELSQLSRACEMRSDKRPMLSDLRDSGAIEQDADVVMFIYRDEVYYPNTDRRGDTELIIAKNRDGVTGTVNLLFQGSTNRFLNPAISVA